MQALITPGGKLVDSIAAIPDGDLLFCSTQLYQELLSFGEACKDAGNLANIHPELYKLLEDMAAHLSTLSIDEVMSTPWFRQVSHISHMHHMGVPASVNQDA